MQADVRHVNVFGLKRQLHVRNKNGVVPLDYKYYEDVKKKK